jgi:hypothetical protein
LDSETLKGSTNLIKRELDWYENTFRALRARNVFSLLGPREARPKEREYANVELALSQRRASRKQKVLQRSNPFVSETFFLSAFWRARLPWRLTLLKTTG